MKKPLKELLQEQFEAAELSNEQLNQLRQLQNKTLAQKNSTRKKRFMAGAFVSTAIMCLAALVFIFNPANNHLAQDIAKEVAHNHFKLKPLEVEGDSVVDVAGFFTKLDFNPIESSVMGKQTLSLLGGRYCSIKSIAAAQLRFIDQNSGKMQSLYQVPYDAEIYGPIPNADLGEVPLEVYYNGLLVTLWTEKGLLMALTHSE